jgi:RNA polymerase sigma factor (sigma-70 family)
MDGRRARFEAQVMPHLDAAYRFARWLARSGADADDIVQEALLRAYRGFDALRGSDIKPWLLTIVRNCHATAHRSRQRHATVPLPEDNDANEGYAMAATAPGPESAAIEGDAARNFERLLSELSEEHREVLALRELEELSYREIADMTSVPIGTVMSRLARARSALRELWLHDCQGELRGVR